MNPNTPASADAPMENFGLLIRNVKDLLRREIERRLVADGHDISFVHATVVRLLDSGGAMGAGELARQLGHDPGAMTRVIDRLVAAGFVRRDASPEDRRATLISLTDAGRALARAATACVSQALRHATRDLSDAERDQLYALLRRVQDALQDAP